MIITKYDRNISNLFFENQPNEICSHLSKKVSKGWSEMLQNYRNEGKGKEKKKQRGEGKEEKRNKAMAALVVFIIATLESFWRRKLNC